ncbi:MAG: glycosyl hydrolase [Chloroflexota bacterium]
MHQYVEVPIRHWRWINCRLDIFKEHIIAFRKWMAANGYRDKPLAVTEFGILLGVEDGYTPERIAQYLRESVSWLETAVDEELGYSLDGNRLVQRWAWFSLADRYFPVSDLANLEADTITIVGQAYREYNLSPAK